jgi:hypothetical protein
MPTTRAPLFAALRPRVRLRAARGSPGSTPRRAGRLGHTPIHSGSASDGWSQRPRRPSNPSTALLNGAKWPASIAPSPIGMNEHLVPCSDCGQPISRRATVCPSCGGPNPIVELIGEPPLIDSSQDLTQASEVRFGARRWSEGRINRTTYATSLLVIGVLYFSGPASDVMVVFLSVLKMAIAVLRARDIGVPSLVTMSISVMQSACILVSELVEGLPKSIYITMLVVIVLTMLFFAWLLFAPGVKEVNRYGHPPRRGIHMPWPPLKWSQFSKTV